jgi:DNA-binding transcriptional ArsR family regulator
LTIAYFLPANVMGNHFSKKQIDICIYNFYYSNIMELSNYITVLSSLAHESRLIVFRLLVSAGPAGKTPGEITEQLSIPAATLSFHLKELRIAGLVNMQKQGRSIRYSTNYDTMRALMLFLNANCCSEPMESSIKS